MFTEKKETKYVEKKLYIRKDDTPLVALSEDPCSVKKNPNDASQTSVTPVSGDQASSPNFFR